MLMYLLELSSATLHRDSEHDMYIEIQEYIYILL